MNKKRKLKTTPKLIIQAFFYLLLGIVFLVVSIFYTNYKTYSSNENSSAEYMVCLKKNDYYKDACLTEGMEYLSQLTDKIRLTLKYNNVYTKKVDSDFKYYIKANVNISNADSGKTLYKTEDIIQKSKSYDKTGEVVTLTEDVTVDYNKYNKLVNEYISKYGVTSNAILDVGLYIEEDKVAKEVSAVQIGLAKQTYNITKDTIKDNTVDIKASNINVFSIIGLVFVCLALVVGIYAVIRLITIKDADLTAYEKELRRILTEYDRVIVDASSKKISLINKELVEVKSFLELVDVRDTIEKPIVHLTVNEDKSEFYVQDEKIVYKFTMSEDDFSEEL